MDLKSVKIFFIIFYLAGLTGIMIPVTQLVFIKLIPLALLFGIIALILFHDSKADLKTLFISVIIFLLGLLIEIIGVNTGKIFGLYSYGNSLGIKLLNTPVSIGLNWLMLVYVSSSVVNNFMIPAFIKVIAASLLMVIYDMLLEWVAPYMHMWYWKNGKVPLQNYMAWFVIGAFFLCLFQLFHIRANNRMALFLYGIQIVFFFTLAIYFNL
jgi:bisanhydrobacterioruberin hydratase